MGTIDNEHATQNVLRVILWLCPGRGYYSEPSILSGFARRLHRFGAQHARHRKLSLESPTALIVAATRGGVLGGTASTTRSVYRRR